MALILTSRWTGITRYALDGARTFLTLRKCSGRNHPVRFKLKFGLKEIDKLSDQGLKIYRPVHKIIGVFVLFSGDLEYLHRIETP